MYRACNWVHFIISYGVMFTEILDPQNAYQKKVFYLYTGTTIPGRVQSFSSYPGRLMSGDDYYLIGSKLVGLWVQGIVWYLVQARVNNVLRDLPDNKGVWSPKEWRGHAILAKSQQNGWDCGNSTVWHEEVYIDPLHYTMYSCLTNYFEWNWQQS